MKTEYDTLKVSELLASLEEEKLVLPPYQRRGVWDEGKQKKLIASLKNDWPIGSLLFSNRGGESEKKYLLIDGQQRVTAIRNYCRNPCRYLDAEAIDAAALQSLVSFVVGRVGEEAASKVDIAVSEWLSSCTSMTKKGRFSPSVLAGVLNERVGVMADADLVSVCEDVVNDLSQNWDLSGRQVPVVFFSGSSDAIAEIFSLINTQGEPLGKFDIVAAAWFRENTDTVITNSKIVSHIRASYDRQTEDGMTFEAPYDDRSPMLVEYLFGLGKMLIEAWPKFFGRASASNETDELGFKIAAICHGLPFGIKPMERLNEVMKARCRTAEGIDPGHFEKAVLEACEFVASALDGILSIRLNRASLQGAPEILHNTDQLVSMICRVVVGKYAANFKTVRKEWAQENGVLRTTLRQFLLHDIIDGQWQGAAATRLFERVWVSVGDGKHEPSPFYLRGYDRAQWGKILAGYHDKLKMQRRRSGRHVTKAHKTFLKYAIHSSLQHSQQFGEAYEIEHLYPVSRLEKLIKGDRSDQAGWAIDHVANLALFSRKLNREKSGETLSEYVAKLTSADRKRLNKEGLNMLMCDVSDVSLPGKGTRFSRSDYESFLDKRFATMSQAVLDCLFK